MNLSRALFTAAICGLFVVGSVKAQTVIQSQNNQSFDSSGEKVTLTNGSPWVEVAPAIGSTVQPYIAWGNSSITASLTTSHALLPGGECFNVGGATTIAGITSTGTATLNITQVSFCPPGLGFAGGGGGGGGGGGSVTQGTTPWVNDITQLANTNLGTPVTWGSTPSGIVLSANVNCVAGYSSSTSITSWAGGTLGAMTNYGTSPGTVLVPGVNANVTGGSITANAGTNLNTSSLALESGGNL